MDDNDSAEDALVGLAADIVESLSYARALELSGGPPGAARPPDFGLTRTQALLAANNAPATPVAKGAKRFCSYCGGTENLVPGPDQAYGATDDWLCADSRSCIARRERRYPPDPDKVNPDLLRWAGEADRAALARVQPRVPGSPDLEPPAPGSGQFAPPPPAPRDGWQHTLRHPASRSHLLGADGFTQQLYGRALGPGAGTRRRRSAAALRRAAGVSGGTGTAAGGDVDSGNRFLPGA